MPYQIFRLLLNSNNLSGNDTSDDYTTQFDTPLFLPGNWEVAIQEANLYYSWFNISPEKNNNIIRYYNGTVYRGPYTIPSGQYTAESLSTYIQETLMKPNGDYTLVGTVDVYDITLSSNFSTGKVRIEISSGYTLDLSLSDIYLLLGFDSIEVTTTQEGANLANVNDSINSLYIRTDVLEEGASILNNSYNDVIDSFIPDSIPFSSLRHIPNNLIFLPVKKSSGNRLSKIRIYLTDDFGSGRRINLNGQPFSVNLIFRSFYK